MKGSFEGIDLETCEKSLIFLDIDGTLVNDDMQAPTKEVIKKASDIASQHEVYLCSNSFNHERNEQVKKATNLRLIKGYRKPNKKILTCVEKKELLLPKIVIGDKVLTDGLFAYRIGAKFIKVKRKVGKDRLRIKLYNLLDDIAALALSPLF